MMKWALVIFLSGGNDGGRAINTELRYTDQTACNYAASVLNAPEIRKVVWVLAAVCVPVQ